MGTRQPTTPQPTTPSQTVGPFFALPGALPWSDGPLVVPEGTPGAIRISGRVFDGAGEPVPDALIETWQADPDGRFAHPDDPRGPSAYPLPTPPAGGNGTGGNGTGGNSTGAVGVPAGRDADSATGGLGAAGWALGHGPTFRGLGRCPTDPRGRYWILTLKPGPVPAPGVGQQAPHINVSVLARGMLQRLVTRIYFPDEAAANDRDPLLSTIDEPEARAALVAVAEDGGLRFDIHLQGADETTFFDL